MARQDKSTITQTSKTILNTPIGVLIIEARDHAVCAISLARENQVIPEESGNEPVLDQAKRELKEYFGGKRTAFTFAMKAEGTPFQKSVWNALLTIPFGETKTYGEIAKAVDNPKGSRAVGMACNRNPIMIAVPCHRVLGAGGAMTGYAGGVPVKEALLDLEQKSR